MNKSNTNIGVSILNHPQTIYLLKHESIIYNKGNFPFSTTSENSALPKKTQQKQVYSIGTEFEIIVTTNTTYMIDIINITWERKLLINT